MRYTFTSGDTKIMKAIVVSKLPLDLPLPSLDDIAAVYGLAVTINNTLNADDAEQPTQESIDVTARFIASLWAGPTKVAADIEDDIERSARQIDHEFNVVVKIVAPRGTRRDGVSVLVTMPTATFDGYPVVMSYLDDGHHRSMSRRYSDEEQARANVNLLKTMLRDSDWAWCGALCVWVTWVAEVVGDLEASEWLEHSWLASSGAASHGDERV